MVSKMKKVVLLYVFCGLTISVINAEFTAENVYDFLSRRLDRLNVKIGIIQNEMKKQSHDINDVKNDSASIEGFQIKNMFDDFKREMNTKFADLEEKLEQKVDMKFADLEEKVAQKVDIYLKEEMSSFLNNTNRQNKHALENERNHLKKHFFGIHKSLSAEKNVIRNAINMFQDRVEDVEQNMFSFENASWKGAKGDVGHPGATGPSGMKGSKGEKGLQGETGFKGSEGTKGQKGSPETRKPNVYFHVSVSTDQTLPQNEVIKFTNVFSNQGGGYDSTTGVFTAPHTGAYLFLFFVEVGSGKYNIAFVKLYVDGKYRAYAIDEAAFEGHNTMAGNAYVTYLYAGDKAWIQTGGLTNEDNHKLKDYGTTFTGILLY